MTVLRITRAGPLLSVQDEGRFGALRHGVSASGPMDRAAFVRAGYWIGGGTAAGLEFTAAGIGFVVEDGSVGIGADGGDFVLKRNGIRSAWPARFVAKPGDRVEIAPGAWGNYGYLRFDRELDLPAAMGSLATNLVVGLGGLGGRCLTVGDALTLGATLDNRQMAPHPRPTLPVEGPIRILWGLHADLFPTHIRSRLASVPFTVSSRIDRMGARLVDPTGVFAEPPPLSLVSDAIVPGDIQILGDGTPIVLLRDHQPTGGYPRIATVVSADLDRFAQLRPGTELRFAPLTLEQAHALVKETRP